MVAYGPRYGWLKRGIETQGRLAQGWASSRSTVCQTPVPRPAASTAKRVAPRCPQGPAPGGAGRAHASSKCVIQGV